MFKVINLGPCSSDNGFAHFKALQDCDINTQTSHDKGKGKDIYNVPLWNIVHLSFPTTVFLVDYLSNFT